MNDHTMDRMVALLGAFFAWFLSQPTPIQVIVAVGILAALYPLLVIVRVTTVAAYGAFRGLGLPSLSLLGRAEARGNPGRPSRRPLRTALATSELPMMERQRRR